MKLKKAVTMSLSVLGLIMATGSYGSVGYSVEEEKVIELASKYKIAFNQSHEAAYQAGQADSHYNFCKRTKADEIKSIQSVAKSAIAKGKANSVLGDADELLNIIATLVGDVPASAKELQQRVPRVLLKFKSMEYGYKAFHQNCVDLVGKERARVTIETEKQHLKGELYYFNKALTELWGTVSSKPAPSIHI